MHGEQNSKIKMQKINLTQMTRGCGLDPPSSLETVSCAKQVTAVTKPQGISKPVYSLNRLAIVCLYRRALLMCALMRAFAHLGAALLEARI